MKLVAALVLQPFLLASVCSATGVRVLTPGGGASHPTIQAAIDAASDGDVVLVGAGTYGGFTIANKSLTLLSDPTAEVLVTGPVVVSNIGAGQSVSVTGIAVEPPAPTRPLGVFGCAGDVRFQFCAFRAAQSGTLAYTSFPSCTGQTTATEAALVSSCARLAFNACQFFGGDGIDDGFVPEEIGPNGGDGLVIIGNSTVALFSCYALGGQGGTGGYCAGDGGVAVRSSAGFLYSSGSNLRGGAGVWSYDHWSNGSGGSGVAMSSGSAVLVGSTLQGGQSACIGTLCFAPQHSGGASFQIVDEPARRAFAFAAGAGGATLAVEIHGARGDRFFFGSDFAKAFRYVPSFTGWRFLPVPVLVPHAPDATLLSESTQILLPTRTSLPDRSATAFGLQGFVLTAENEWRTTGPLLHVALDPLLGPDCDANGISDYLDVVAGSSPDVNDNLVPDTCPGG